VTAGAGAAAGPRPWALLILIAIAANLPALFPGFIFDDHRIIEQNALVQEPGRVAEIFTQGYWSVGEGPVPNLYRPLTIASFTANRALFGPGALSFRLFNLLLHAAVVILVWALARRLAGAGSPAGPAAEGGFDPAFLGGVLFAVHPVHTEALGLVVGRAELLAALGTLGCVFLFLEGRERERAAGRASPRRGPWGPYAASLLCFACGFLSKENAVVAPALAVVAGWLVLRWGFAWRYALVAAAAGGALLALRVAVLGSVNPEGFTSFVDNPIAHVEWPAGLLTALKIVLRYAGLLCVPITLSADYSFDAVPVVRTIADPAVLAGGGLLFAWPVAVILLARTRRVAAYGILWIGAALLPVANLLFPVGTVMAERLLYLPSAGLSLILAAIAAGPLAADGGLRPEQRGAVKVSLVLVLAAFTLRGLARYRDWQSDLALFRAAVEVVPRSVKAQFNYGAACETVGDDAAAADAYRKAIEIHPPFAEAHYNLGGVHLKRREFGAAVRHLEEAVRLRPGDVQHLVNLGIALTGDDRPREALEPIGRALDLDRRNDRALTALGNAHLALGEGREAARAYQEAAGLRPGEADYQRNLALALEASGDHDGAVRAWEQAATLRPGDPDLMVALGAALADAGRHGEGIPLLEQVVRAQPAHPVYHYRYGRALESGGRDEEALREYGESIRLAPDVPMPRRALGLLLHRRGDRDGALAALERAAALDPEGRVLDAADRALLERLRSAPRPPARR
jgi:tetratricopeptide (TPR) repeat protein